MLSSRRLTGARAACFSCALALTTAGGSAAAEGALGPPASPFGDWMALGSGCRGGTAGAGDVVEEIVPARDPLAWRVRFRLDGFHLSTEERAPGAPLTFARECGIRIAVVAPPGTRPVFLASEARVVARKSDGAKLTLAGALRLGAAPVGDRVVTYPADGARSGVELFQLAPGSSTPMPSLACGESRIAALDLTWIVSREAASASAHVEMGSPGTAEIEVRLERC